MSDKQTKIMFVDDDLVTGRVMKRNCDNANYSCTVFQSGHDCINAFKKSAADIVITDLRMPGMNGFELAQNIRANPKVGNMPIVILSSLASDDLSHPGRLLAGPALHHPATPRLIADHPQRGDRKRPHRRRQ